MYSLKLQLDETDPAGWYECQYKHGPQRVVRWWNGQKLGPIPDANWNCRRGEHTAFIGPLVPYQPIILPAMRSVRVSEDVQPGQMVWAPNDLRPGFFRRLLDRVRGLG